LGKKGGSAKRWHCERRRCEGGRWEWAGRAGVKGRERGNGKKRRGKERRPRERGYLFERGWKEGIHEKA
jgi:hypothetical protein